MNKSELIDALAARYEGNRKQAAHALESVLDTITREVAKGEKVAITGFGSFEKAVRNARWVRNPQTGERMKSKKKSVPKFSAGKELKDFEGLTAIIAEHQAGETVEIEILRGTFEDDGGKKEEPRKLKVTLADWAVDLRATAHQDAVADLHAQSSPARTHRG